jgi:hypothetical protein
MNERIKLLADEAGIQFYNLSTDDTNNPQMCGSVGVLAWFAQLIVRECAKVASVETSDDGVGEVIREHFEDQE